MISYRVRSQNCQSFNLLHLSVALLQVAHFPKGIRLKSFPYEMRVIHFTNSRRRVVYEAMPIAHNHA